MAAPLTPARRSELRAEAHKLSPLVIIGDKGLTDTVVTEIDRSLKAHELIKVRAMTDDRKMRESWMAEICERLSAHPVQQIGKVLVVYRENFDKPREKKLDPGIRSPQQVGDPWPRKRGARDEDVTRTSRPRSRTPSPLPESGPRRRRRSTSR